MYLANCTLLIRYMMLLINLIGTCIIQLAIGMFPNEVLYFLKLELSPDGITIFSKETNTGPYVNFT